MYKVGEQDPDRLLDAKYKKVFAAIERGEQAPLEWSKDDIEFRKLAERLYGGNERTDVEVSSEGEDDDELRLDLEDVDLEDDSPEQEYDEEAELAEMRADAEEQERALKALEDAQ